jgi:hypothetical protein
MEGKFETFASNARSIGAIAWRNLIFRFGFIHRTVRLEPSGITGDLNS